MRQLHVTHRTEYRYARLVERSTHTLRLEPVHDHLQRLLAHDVQVTVDGEVLRWSRPDVFDDVFGNRVHRLHINRPYHELAIESRATVGLLDTDPLAFTTERAPWSIPMGLMPWQRQVLQPFLLPPELPESELQALLDYATQYAARNSADVLGTLMDMARTIFRDYAYRPGATTLATTPFEVFANRYGVCQDFANLFICLARLLGIPARYVCGYVHTGATHANTRQGEASHAWAQVYLPDVGWRGFDPTNGSVTHTDHVRVAVGRSYMDATPTSGTIYPGVGAEELHVTVSVHEGSPSP